MRRAHLLVLGMALVSCQTPTSGSRLHERLLAAEPAVVKELGSNGAPGPWAVLEQPELARSISVGRRVGQAPIVLYRADWEELSAGALRLILTHEAVHLCGPYIGSYALMEGLADLLMARVHENVQGALFMSHWSKVPEDTDLLVGSVLDRGRPESEQEDAELRAVGFMIFYCMSRAEIQEFVATGQSAVLDELREMTLRDLWNRAARTTQPASLEQQAEPGTIPPTRTPMETATGPAIWLE